MTSVAVKAGIVWSGRASVGAHGKAPRPRVGKPALQVLLALAISIFSPPVAWAGESDASLARRAADLRERLDELREDEDEVLEAVDALGELVAIEAAALAKAEERVRDSEAALAMIEEDIESTTALLQRRLRELEPRLVARYRLGRLGYLPLLLSARSVPELITLRRMLARIVEADMKAIEEVRRLSSMLEEQHISLEAGRRELEDLREGAAARLEGLRESRAEREAALEEIRADAELQQQALAQVQRDRRALRRRMERMAARAERDTGFASLRGRLPRPVPGAITTGFGGGEEGRGGQMIHRGVDIRAPRGTPVRAVADGRVAHADWLRGYGNLVILDHGGGYYTLMAHMERTLISAGEEVEAGDRVGLVGDSGSLDGAHLYFEIRKGAGALDPEVWFSD